MNKQTPQPNQQPPAQSQPQGQPPVDYSQPVAYDTNGQPLYAHPPAERVPYHQSRMAPPGQHYVRRHAEPTAEDMARHEQSKKDYDLHNLATGEYVIRRVPRHPLGYYIPLGLSGLAIAVVLSIVVSYPMLQDNAGGDLPGFGLILMPALLLVALIGLGGYIAYWVFHKNQLYLTNESVIQKIQHSLFARREQKASLANIEDASFRQHGIFPLIFNYGKFRLSTQGDETTYRLTFIANPKKEIAHIHNAISAYKNGRRVEGSTTS